MKKKDHLELLCDAGEMFALLSGVSDTKKILQRCVLLVAKHLKAEVCSIYLLHTPEQELVLHATTGLNPDSVDVVKMKAAGGIRGTDSGDTLLIFFLWTRFFKFEISSQYLL